MKFFYEHFWLCDCILFTIQYFSYCDVSRADVCENAKGVRKHEDYMSKYFISQYGAIKDVDFTPIFEEILCDEKEG